MNKKALQIFDDQYLEFCKKLSVRERIQFLEDFREVVSKTDKTKSKLISIKIPQALLDSFRFKAESQNKKYQTVIKELMIEWLS